MKINDIYRGFDDAGAPVTIQLRHYNSEDDCYIVEYLNESLPTEGIMDGMEIYECFEKIS